MEYVKYEAVEKHTKGTAVVYEYPMQNQEMNIAVAEILDRYPEQHEINIPLDEMATP